jgi:hypothetical protein
MAIATQVPQWQVQKRNIAHDQIPSNDGNDFNLRVHVGLPDGSTNFRLRSEGC